MHLVVVVVIVVVVLSVITFVMVAKRGSVSSLSVVVVVVVVVVVTFVNTIRESSSQSLLSFPHCRRDRQKSWHLHGVQEYPQVQSDQRSPVINIKGHQAHSPQQMHQQPHLRNLTDRHRTIVHSQQQQHPTLTSFHLFHRKGGVILS